MKKKSLPVKKIIHKKLIKYLQIKRVKKTYNLFKKNLNESYFEKKVLVAISGGPDSLALAFFIKCLSLEKKLSPYFYIVDHKLRKDSTKEANLVRNNLKKFDIKCKILTWTGKKPKSNIQSVSRQNRYLLLLKECLKNNIKAILLAHHEDDLYENFFIRILRGSGLKGIVSFYDLKSYLNNEVFLLRPLLNIKKKELEYISNKVFKFYINDPSNSDDLYKRIRLRKLINQLKVEGLDLKKLKLTIANLRDSNVSINYYVNQNLKRNCSCIKENEKYILSDKFFNEPNEIVFRSISKILKQVGKNYYSPRGKSVSKLLEQIYDGSFKKQTLSGCSIEKIANSIIIQRENIKKS
tara:strand:+ start:17510 stop:18565 length:1056 start_codon:yes stop_codon:yes gene_type:complete